MIIILNTILQFCVFHLFPFSCICIYVFMTNMCKQSRKPEDARFPEYSIIKSHGHKEENFWISLLKENRANSPTPVVCVCVRVCTCVEVWGWLDALSFHHGVKDSTQIVRSVWQSPLPAEPPHWPWSIIFLLFPHCLGLIISGRDLLPPLQILLNGSSIRLSPPSFYSYSC